MTQTLFLMDPLESIIPDKDTSFILMCEASRRGHTVLFCPKNGISRKEGKTLFHVTEVVPQKDTTPIFKTVIEKTISEDDIDIIFIRTDPPFDELYLYHTWILDLLPKRIKIINSPSGVRTMNEKIWLSQFQEIAPATLISSNRDEISDFIDQYKTIILKPTNGYGGKDIFKLQNKGTNLNVIVDLMTKNYKNPVIVQEYIQSADKGDKRILLVDGEPIGAVLRVHSDNDHRNNFYAGGKPEKTTITESELVIINFLKPYLNRLGLRFVGIDVIGDYLIEINVTSPTCLQEINRLEGKQLEIDIFDRLFGKG